jgi:hypothetical protein
MSEPVVDLGPVLRSLHVVNDNLVAVGQQVASVSQQQAEARSKLDQLALDFAAFVRQDLLDRELQLSETRRVKVRQELEQRFGHHVEVRRRLTGILQATDVAIVRQETLRTTSEELMVATPGYWLAPALIALTSWIGDQEALAQQALAEALRRDAAKTALLFALVCRRAGRHAALRRWLAQYFQALDPQALSRQVLVLLDAVASGVFGGAAREECLRVSGDWIAELETQGGFLDEQRRRWTVALDARTPRVGAAEFPALRQYSPTWPPLERALAAARRNGAVAGYFRQLFAGEIVPPARLEAAVDEILDALVGQFDDQELVLRREERLLALIVAARGDRASAEHQMQAEASAFEEKVPFTALLTNAAMHAEASQTSVATQRYAVALSRDWILMAHQDMLARDRAAVPAEVEIKIQDWSGTSRDGANETELAGALGQHYDAKIAQAVAAVTLGCLSWAGIGLAALSMLAIVMAISAHSLGGAVLFFLFTALAVGLVALGGREQEKRRATLRKQLTEQRDWAIGVLRAGLAELADLRRAWSQADAEAAAVGEALLAARSEQQVVRRADDARAVLS